VAFAFALVIQFNYKPVTFTEADIVDEDEFSPPISCRWMCEQLIVNVSQELVINVPIEFADAHLVLLSGHKIATCMLLSHPIDVKVSNQNEL